MKKSERSCVEIWPKFYENSAKITPKLRQNGAQSGPRGSRGSKSHAKITKTRPEALGSGTVVAFWRKNGAQGGSQGFPECTKMRKKCIKNGIVFQVCFRTSFFDGFSWICGGFWWKKRWNLQLDWNVVFKEAQARHFLRHDLPISTFPVAQKKYTRNQDR